MRDGVHRPDLEVGGASGEEVGAGRDVCRRVVGGPVRPADRTEEADGVVLDAVALPVAGDRRLVIAAPDVARFPGGGLVDTVGDECPVLPGHRLAERRVAGDVADLLRQLGRRALIGGLVVLAAALARRGPVGRRRQLDVAEAVDLGRREAGASQHRLLPDRPVAAAEAEQVLARHRRHPRPCRRVIGPLPVGAVPR
jgi:hypothetical protein